MAKQIFFRCATALGTAVRWILLILLAVSVALTAFSGILKYIVMNEGRYTTIADNEIFLKDMVGYVENSLESECLFYDIPFDAVKACVSEEALRPSVSAFVSSVYQGLFTGTEMASISVGSESYRQAIEAFFSTLSENERPIDENASATIAAEMAQMVSLVLQGGIGNQIVTLGHQLLSNRYLIAFVRFFPILLGISTFLLMLSLLLSFHIGFRRRLYAATGALVVGSMLAFVPLFLLKVYNLPARLVLGESPMKLYVSGILNSIIDASFFATLIMLLVSLILLLTTIFFLAGKKKRPELPQS